MTEGWHEGFHYVIDSGRMDPKHDGTRVWAKLDSLHDERGPGPAIRVQHLGIGEVLAEDDKAAVAEAEKRIKLAIDKLAQVK